MTAIAPGEILCIAGLTAGMNATQKNDYGITVMTGPSISELILSPEEIDYTGIDNPEVVVALAPEGVTRRREIFERLGPKSLVIQAAGVEIPATRAQVLAADFKALGVKKSDWALAALALMAKQTKVLSREMLEAALELRFKPKVVEAVKEQIGKVFV